MQDLPAASSALVDGEPSVWTITERELRATARAICHACRGETFQVIIYGDGSHEIICSNCQKFWTPIGQGSASIVCSSETVGEGRDEPAHLVSQKGGR